MAELPAPQNFRMLVSTRQCLAFAAVTGYDQDPLVDDSKQPVHAAPGFPVCLEWPVHSRGAHYESLGLSDAERQRSVHAWQDTRQFAPIVADRHVDVRGTLVQAMQSRSGLKLVSRYDTFDAESQSPLSSTHTCVVLRGVVRDVPRDVPRLEPQTVGLTNDDAVVDLALDRQFPHLYSECTGIWNPIHTERAVALKQGLPDILVHGSAMWAVIARLLLTEYRGAAGIDCKRLYGAFRSPVVAGAHLRVHRRCDARRASYRATSAGAVAVEGFVEW